MTMTDTWQPLFFEPVFRDYLWGGRRLGTVLGKPIGDGDTWAESWEVVDHGDDQSVVAAGDHAGSTLHALVQQYGKQLLGAPADRFPLLFKFLDANQVLSLQVHPNDAQAATLDPPDLGKTEAWVVLDAAPGARLYAGLREGVTPAALRAALESGAGDDCMHSFEPQPGDCVFIPAGVPHAIGAGLLVAEIQQASNTTFRLHDWNRTGADGKPRELHVESGLAVIDYDYGPVRPQSPQPTQEPGRERLVACDKFILDRLHPSSPQQVFQIGGDQRFHILAVLEGELELRGAFQPIRMTRGQTTLLPASLSIEAVGPVGDFTALDMYLPSPG